jgi:hypothetical protein
MNRPRKTASHILEELRKKYAADPEPGRQRSRARRAQHGAAINRRRRERAAERRAERRSAELAAYQPNPTLTSGGQLKHWLRAHGWTNRRLASEIGSVSARQDSLNAPRLGARCIHSDL